MFGDQSQPPNTKRPNSRLHISRHSPAAGIEIATPTIKNPAEGVSKQVLGKKHRGVKKRAGADANVKWLFATESLANKPKPEQVVPLLAAIDISATAGAGVDPLPHSCPDCFPCFGSDIRRHLFAHSFPLSRNSSSTIDRNSCRRGSGTRHRGCSGSHTCD